MIDTELLKILCCPETHQEVMPASQTQLEWVNRRIAEGTLKNRGGRLVEQPIEAGLVRADGKFLYPIREKIPIMLIEEAIALEI